MFSLSMRPMTHHSHPVSKTARLAQLQATIEKTPLKKRKQ